MHAGEPEFRLQRLASRNRAWCDTRARPAERRALAQATGQGTAALRQLFYAVWLRRRVGFRLLASSAEQGDQVLACTRTRRDDASRAGYVVETWFELRSSPGEYACRVDPEATVALLACSEDAAARVAFAALPPALDRQGHPLSRRLLRTRGRGAPEVLAPA